MQFNHLFYIKYLINNINIIYMMFIHASARNITKCCCKILVSKCLIKILNFECKTWVLIKNGLWNVLTWATLRNNKFLVLIIMLYVFVNNSEEWSFCFQLTIFDQNFKYCEISYLISNILSESYQPYDIIYQFIVW